MTDTCGALLTYRRPLYQAIHQEVTEYHCSLEPGHDGWHVSGALTWPGFLR